MIRWLLASVVLFSSGCEALMGPSAPPSPKPRPSSRPEAKTIPLRRADRADQMAIMVGANPRDTDGDSYPDVLDVTAMLLEGSRNDLVFVPGSFEFELVPLDESIEQPWRVWIFDARQTASAAGPTLFNLPGYTFVLDLRVNGGDRMFPVVANLTGRFQATSGGPVVEALPGQRVVQLGNEPSRR